MKGKQIIKSLTAYGVKYRIKYKDMHESEAGECDKSTKVITVDIKHDILDSMVHEYSHAMIHESGIDGVLSGDMEEMICVMNEKIVKNLIKANLLKVVLK